MDELKQLAAILIRILCKPVTLELWTLAVVGFAGLCGVGLLHGWFGWAFLAFVGLVCVGVLVAYGKIEKVDEE